GCQAAIDEFLHPLAAIRFRRIDISLRIGGDAVYAVKFSGLAATFSEAGQDLQRLAIEYVHSIILSVGQIKVLLLRVLRKCDIPGGAGATRLTIDKRFLDEAAIGLENLNAIIHPVADIEQAVIGEFNTVHR